MPEKKKPKYQIIEDYLLERINSNELRPGDQIETEMELSQKFNIGRLTVNKALNYLANAGYIERIAGKGSFVLASKCINLSIIFTLSIIPEAFLKICVLSG